MNVFPRETEKTPSGYGLIIVLSEGGDVDGSTGFFSELGLAVMLEASDCDSFDSESSVLRASFDVFQGDIENNEVTSVFTDHVDLYAIYTPTQLTSGPTKYVIFVPYLRIVDFKTFPRSGFGQYQAYCMGTQKWQLLDCFVDNLEHAGCIQSFHGKQYESSHRLFKALTRKTSQKFRIAMDETIIRQNCQIEQPLFHFIPEKRQRESL